MEARRQLFGLGQVFLPLFADCERCRDFRSSSVSYALRGPLLAEQYGVAEVFSSARCRQRRRPHPESVLAPVRLKSRRRPLSCAGPPHSTTTRPRKDVPEPCPRQYRLAARSLASVGIQATQAPGCFSVARPMSRGAHFKTIRITKSWDAPACHNATAILPVDRQNGASGCGCRRARCRGTRRPRSSTSAPLSRRYSLSTEVSALANSRTVASTSTRH